MLDVDLLRKIKEYQKRVRDSTRVFYDGSIKTISLTDSGEIGWCVIAKSVPGCAPVLTPLFGGEKFLKVEDLREAISLRDSIIGEVVSKKGN